MSHLLNTVRSSISALALLISGFAAAKSAPTEFEQIGVEVVGKGTPVLMIPGLNSAGAVWRETCQALQAHAVQCHIVHLPGFAGRPAVTTENFVDEMGARLLRYLDHAKLKSPVVMGHSLGGVIGMQMAIAKPARLHKLVIVDSLPFFAAAGNPAITEAQAQTMAQGMRAGMLAADESSYRAQAEMALTNMSNQPERLDTLKQWGKDSARETTAQAMAELMGRDLRDELATIQTPTLMLGAWAGFANYGGTRESVGKVFNDQYATLKGVRIELSEAGYHFLMWDDPKWLVTKVSGFIAEKD